MRSKMLCVANILATVYSIALLCCFGDMFVKIGGAEAIGYWQDYFELLSGLPGYGSITATTIYTIITLLVVHIIAFSIGALFGWIGFACRKTGLAAFAAVFYLIGTISFPIFVFFGLPIMIFGFVGKGKQKKINLSA